MVPLINASNVIGAAAPMIVCALDVATELVARLFVQVIHTASPEAPAGKVNVVVATLVNMW